MRGLWHSSPAPREGTVVVDPRPELRPSPGLRTVRVHPLADLSRLPGLLHGWKGRLQGAALAGEAAWSLEPELRELGISRFAPPGELQSPDASWHNGGIDPLEALEALTSPSPPDR
jgi:Acyl-CoA reductase (LuxC)